MPHVRQTKKAAYAAILAVMATPLGWMLSSMLFKYRLIPLWLIKPVTGLLFFGIISVAMVLFLRKIKPLEKWGFHAGGGRGLVIIAATALAVVLLTALNGRIYFSERSAVVLAAALSAAIFDEVVFRAALFNGLRSDLPQGFAAVLVSLLFVAFSGYGHPFYEYPFMFALSYLFCGAFYSGTGLGVLIPAGFAMRAAPVLFASGKLLRVQDIIAVQVVLASFSLCLGHYLLTKKSGPLTEARFSHIPEKTIS